MLLAALEIKRYVYITWLAASAIDVVNACCTSKSVCAATEQTVSCVLFGR